MAVSAEPPDHDALAAELKLLREKGLARIRSLELPALVAAGRIATADESSEAHVVVEAALRRAVERFGGGAYGEAAALLFGLDQGTRTLNSRVRRELAAERMERTADTFRKRYEPTMLAEIATQVLTLCSEQHSRHAREEMERRQPAESAMAVDWLRRFEAYYRLWSPISGIGHDLTAYRIMLLEPDRPWDRRFGTQGPDDKGYSQEEHAERFARFALYHYALYQWELRQFVTRYGGLWLLSDGQTEQAVSGAVYRIFWHAAGNERSDSFLRTLIQDTPDQELHGFLERLAANDIGQAIEREWQKWAATCECVWNLDALSDEEEFPTRHHHGGIREHCHVHEMIEACGEYLDLIDQDWLKVADWYHIEEPVQRGVVSGQLYAKWRSEERANRDSDVQ